MRTGTQRREVVNCERILANVADNDDIYFEFINIRSIVAHWYMIFNYSTLVVVLLQQLDVSILL